MPAARDLALLKCTSAYPASPADSNLRTIAHLARGVRRARSACPITRSGIGAAVAVGGARRHRDREALTLRRADGGVDSAFSLEAQELRQLVEETERARLALGGVRYGPGAGEVNSLRFRRSLYVVRAMRAGEAFSRDNVRAIRPGLGLPPKHIDRVLGRRAALDISAGTALAWDLVG